MKNWTPELMKTLDYDPSRAKEKDDGKHSSFRNFKFIKLWLSYYFSKIRFIESLKRQVFADRKISQTSDKIGKHDNFNKSKRFQAFSGSTTNRCAISSTFSTSIGTPRYSHSPMDFMREFYFLKLRTSTHKESLIKVIESLDFIITLKYTSYYLNFFYIFKKLT